MKPVVSLRYTHGYHELFGRAIRGPLLPANGYRMRFDDRSGFVYISNIRDPNIEVAVHGMHFEHIGLEPELAAEPSPGPVPEAMAVKAAKAR